MRSKLSRLFVGCALALAATPVLACPFHNQASSDSQAQQTAQADSSGAAQAQ